MVQTLLRIAIEFIIQRSELKAQVLSKVISVRKRQNHAVWDEGRAFVQDLYYEEMNHSAESWIF